MIQTISDTASTRRDGVADEEECHGFTVIELTVVILIIGILAAIAIPVFVDRRSQAWSSSVQSDLVNAAIAAESYAVSNKGSYANLTKDLLVSNGFKETTGNLLVVGAASDSEYVLTDSNSNLSTTWTSTTGVVTTR